MMFKAGKQRALYISSVHCFAKMTNEEGKWSVFKGAGTTGEMGVTGAGSGPPFFYKRPSIGGIMTFLAQCWMSLYFITCFFLPSCSSSLRASCSRHHCSLIFMVT